MAYCDDTFIGGPVILIVGNQQYQVIDKMNLKTGGETREVGRSTAGKKWATAKLIPYTAEMTVASFKGSDPFDLFNLTCGVDVTIIEVARNVQHLFSDAVISGDMELDTANGQATGIKIESDLYERMDYTG